MVPRIASKFHHNCCGFPNPLARVCPSPRTDFIRGSFVEVRWKLCVVVVVNRVLVVTGFRDLDAGQKRGEQAFRSDRPHDIRSRDRNVRLIRFSVSFLSKEPSCRNVDRKLWLDLTSMFNAFTDKHIFIWSVASKGLILVFFLKGWVFQRVEASRWFVDIF